MRSHATKLVAVLCVLASFLVGATGAIAAPVVDGVFPVKSEVATNNKIVAGPDGNVWFTVSDATNDVAKVTPAGLIEEFDIEGIETATGIAVGPDGNLWITDVEKAARFSPADPLGTDKSFSVAGVGAEGQVVAGPDGLIWVASNNQLVHFAPADPTNTVQPVTVNGAFSPKDIDVAGSLIVVADFGTPRIATFTTGGVQVDFALAGGPQGVAGGPGGQIAFSQQGVQPEEVGTINPPSPPQGKQIDGDPFGVTLGPDGAYWIARSAAGELIRLTTSGQTTTLPGFPPKYFPRQLTAGPGNTLWVTMEIPGENTAAIARVSGVTPEATPQPSTPPPITSPQTKIDKGPKKVVKTRNKKAKVKFRFSSSTPGVTFQCWLMRVSKKAQQAILKYKACSSPKIYRLRPGKYKFRVRAVNGGVPDLTPAVRNFRIVRIR
jgi:virginiamycin B lyase